MEEKPLHVKVAEVLGWTRVHYRDECHGDILLADQERMRWKGRDPKDMLVGVREHAICTIIPRFDQDWGITGPLIEKYHIQLFYDIPTDLWTALSASGQRMAQASPLRAVCLLLVIEAQQRAMGVL